MNIFFSIAPDPNRNYDNKFEQLNGKPDDERYIIAYQRANSSTNLPEQDKNQICNTYFYLIFDLFRFAPYGIEEILTYLIPRLQVIPINSRKLCATLRQSGMKDDVSIVSAHTMALFSFYCLILPFSIHAYTKHLLSQASKGNALAIEFPFYDKLFIELLKHASGEATNFGWEFHLLCSFTNAVVPSKKCSRRTLVGEDARQMYATIERIIETNDLQQCVLFIKNNLLVSSDYSDMQKVPAWDESLGHLFASSACLLLGVLRYRVMEKVLRTSEYDDSIPLSDLIKALFIKEQYQNRLIYMLRSMEEILEAHKKLIKFISKRDRTWHVHKTIIDWCSENESAKKKLSFLLIAIDLRDNYSSVLPMADWSANGAERRLITTCIDVLFQKDSLWQVLYPYASGQLPQKISWKPPLSHDLASTDLSKILSDIQEPPSTPSNSAKQALRPPSPVTQPIKMPLTAFQTPQNHIQVKDTSQKEPSSPPSIPSSPTTSDLDYERISLNLFNDAESQSDMDWSYYEVQDKRIPHFKLKGRLIHKKQSLVACAVNQHVISQYSQAYYDAIFLIVNHYLQRRAFRAWCEALAVKDCRRLVADFAQEIFEVGQFYADKWTRHKNLLDLRLNQFIQQLAFCCWVDCYQDRIRLKEESRRSSYERKIQAW